MRAREGKTISVNLLIVGFHVEPVTVLEDIEGVDGHRGQDKYQIKDSQCNQQPIEGVLP